MKRTLIVLILILALLTTMVCAYTPQDNNTADALHDLGLFQGMGGTRGYDLDSNLTRGQGITLLVRMLGKESAALNGTYYNSFTDVPDWAKGYIGYAFANGITNGMSETAFGTDVPMTDYMFLTLVLRALAYSDAGAAPQFTWDKPYTLAAQLGLISFAGADNSFTRADAIRILWNAMSVQFNGRTDTLSDSLMAQNVFTAAQWADAQEVRAGRKPQEDSSTDEVEDREEDKVVIPPQTDESDRETDPVPGDTPLKPETNKPGGEISFENETERDY